LKIDKESGLLVKGDGQAANSFRFAPSPHCDARPNGAEVDMIVVHGISLPPGQFGTDAVEAFFQGQLRSTTHPYYAKIADLRVSSHLFIKRTGEIVQFVPFSQRAWHAGESIFEGKPRCNDFSIGIELEGTDEIPYDQRQYEQLVNVVKLLLETYPTITRERIVGHADIAPGRKTDPGPIFDWAYLKGKLA
jgi:N-acetyl-anhydromuramoyl-L-alanine amidase